MKGKVLIDSMEGKVILDSMEDCSPSSKKKYIRKFQSKWLTDDRFSSWLIPCEDNVRDAFCTLCNRKISGSVTLLERHRRTKKHLKKIMNSDPMGEAHDVFPTFFAKREKKTKCEEDEEGLKGNFGSDDYDIADRSTVPEDHNTYFISSSMNHPSSDRKSGKLYKDTLEAASFLRHTLASSRHQEEDEFDHFGKSIASQLRKLPEECAISLISEMQCLVTTRRLKVIADREAQTPSITSQVLTVSLDENAPFST